MGCYQELRSRRGFEWETQTSLKVLEMELSMCRAKVTGPVDMAVNHSLEPWELDAGYRLTCQSRARSDDLVVDYDA